MGCVIKAQNDAGRIQVAVHRNCHLFLFWHRIIAVHRKKTIVLRYFRWNSLISVATCFRLISWENVKQTQNVELKKIKECFYACGYSSKFDNKVPWRVSMLLS